jgi:hyperosmotically inducible protein
MKKIFLVQSGFFVWVIVAVTMGCATPFGSVYKSAVDQRSLGTQYDDEKITMEIRGKFLEDKAIHYLDISTYCYDGNVYLVGEYEKPEQKNQAVKLAAHVPGVKSVTDYFLPKRKDDSCGTSDNLAAEAKVRAELIEDMDLSSTQIETKLIQCQVVLLGLVQSRADIEKAVSLARTVSGVRTVKSFLTVSR